VGYDYLNLGGNRQSTQTKTRIEGILTNNGQLNLEGTTIYNVPYTRAQIGGEHATDL